MEELSKDFNFVTQITVYWGDMDAFRHVNNVVYFRYFEHARICYFNQLKLFQDTKGREIGPILQGTKANFLKPISYPDTLSIGVKSIAYSEDKIIQRYSISSHRHIYIATEGEAIIFGYNYVTLRRAPIPSEIIKQIAAFENNTP